MYSQVVTIACYSYFLAALFGSQIIESESRYKEIDFGYFPVFLILQFVFYMGWLKVAEQCKYLKFWRGEFNENSGGFSDESVW